ncbi:MAG: patatin-like phospholipase family protein [Acholeplasma sp.]|nr:patatin-like phospholipase family protein [Acholeplasma sp.]
MKVGLALGGGGSKGSYQVGVIRALIEEGLLDDLEVVAGTSIGAINACLIMEHASYGRIMEIWNEMNNSVLYKNGLNRFKLDRLGLFDQTVMYDIIVSKQSKEAITNSDIKGFAAVTRIKEYNIRKQLSKESMVGEIISLNDSEDPHRVVLASSSVPIVFGPTEIDGEYYVDGGLFNNLPINVLVDQECDVIIAIGLNPDYELEQYNINNDRLIVDFSPDKKLTISVLGMLDFDNKTMQKRLDLGYDNAQKLIKFLKKDFFIEKDKWNNEKKGIVKYRDVVENNGNNEL